MIKKHPIYNCYVSDMGLVYSDKVSLLASRTDKFGNVKVLIDVGNNKRQYKLVADLVNDVYCHIDGKVSHKDGNRSNNCYLNLVEGVESSGYVIICSDPYYESPLFKTIDEATTWLIGFDSDLADKKFESVRDNLNQCKKVYGKYSLRKVGNKK